MTETQASEPVVGRLGEEDEVEPLIEQGRVLGIIQVAGFLQGVFKIGVDVDVAGD